MLDLNNLPGEPEQLERHDSRKFTAREDDGTGLYYYRARYYQPALGRFVSEDPLGLSGGNIDLYTYVTDNPVNFYDPSGEQVVETATVVASAGAAPIVMGGAAATALYGAALYGAYQVGNTPAIKEPLSDLLEPLFDSRGRHESGQWNYLDDLAARRARLNGTDICTELYKMMQTEKTKCGGKLDSKLMKEFIQALKAAGCYGTRKQR